MAVRRREAARWQTGARSRVDLHAAHARPQPQEPRRGEPRTFVGQALDPPRRGIELAPPEVARVAGAPTEETVEAETAEPAPTKKKAAKKKVAAGKKKAPVKKAAPEPEPADVEPKK